MCAYSTSFGKYFNTVSAGLGAACPSPQIEESIMACDSSCRRGAFQRGCCINCRALAVPTRQGVHCPHDSSEKNFMTFDAAPRAVSRLDRTTTAADPMKQPYGFSVSKSSGIFAMDAGRMP